MGLLRVLGYVVFYGSIVALAYWRLTAPTNSLLLWLAVAALIIGIVILVMTYDRRRTRLSSDTGVWDWWNILELLEIPLRLIVWLLSRVRHLFD